MAQKRINRVIEQKDGKFTGNVIFEILATGDKITASAQKLLGKDAKFGELPVSAQRMLLHGMNAKYGDSAADPNADAAAQIKATIEQVEGGIWATKGSGGGGPKVSMLAEALQRVTNQPLDAVVDRVDSMSDEEKKELRNHPAVAKASADIRAERAAEKAKAKAAAAKDAPSLDALFK